MALDLGSLALSSGLSLGGSLASGLLGSGSSRKANRQARDAQALSNYLIQSAQSNAKSGLSPYQQTGEGANNLLAQLLGVATPSSVGAKPTLEQFQNEVRAEHFNKTGSDYRRDSNMALVNQDVQQRYDKALAQWNADVAAAREADPSASGSGWLLSQFTGEDLENEPGYQFRRDEGELGVNRALTSGGRYDSGSALKALTRFNQDYASNEYQNAHNRDAANKDRTFNYLTNTSNSGQNAATTLANLATGNATNLANIAQNTASTISNANTNSANAWNNAIQGGIGNVLTAYLRNNNGWNTGSSGLNSWTSGGSSNTGGPSVNLASLGSQSLDNLTGWLGGRT